MTPIGSSKTTTTVSAPGKVLFVGGYLVLDRSFSGLVVGCSARFKVSVTSSAAPPPDRPSAPPTISVRSPQFVDGAWEYRAVKVAGCGLRVEPESGSARNRYVEVALTHALIVALGLTEEDRFWRAFGSHLEVLILGDNDFYSQREQLKTRGLPVSTASLASLEPYCSTMTTIADVHKTGLGSSAAMITSLVGAVLCHFGAVQLSPVDQGVAAAAAAASSSTSSSPPSPSPSEGLRIVHNTAQLAHCFAQGKVGSGFDVSAAVYGSHAYRRFSPRAIDALMARLGSSGGGEVVAVGDFVAAVAAPWDNEVRPFRLPPRCRLMLGDVDAGSNTPKLVSGVLAWRKEKPTEADPLWADLHSLNCKVEGLLRELGRAASETPEQYQDAVNACGNALCSEWTATDAPLVAKFISVSETFQRVRSLLRKMSRLAGVPVEPEVQTRLLDGCQASAPGVLMAGVPGAGGFDAVFVVVVEPEEQRRQAAGEAMTNAQLVERVWQSWRDGGGGAGGAGGVVDNAMRVGPLLSEESSDGLVVVERV